MNLMSILVYFYGKKTSHQWYWNPDLLVLRNALYHCAATPSNSFSNAPWFCLTCGQPHQCAYFRFRVRQKWNEMPRGTKLQVFEDQGDSAADNYQSTVAEEFDQKFMKKYSVGVLALILVWLQRPETSEQEIDEVCFCRSLANQTKWVENRKPKLRGGGLAGEGVCWGPWHSAAFYEPQFSD